MTRRHNILLILYAISIDTPNAILQTLHFFETLFFGILHFLDD